MERWSVVFERQGAKLVAYLERGGRFLERFEPNESECGSGTTVGKLSCLLDVGSREVDSLAGDV